MKNTLIKSLLLALTLASVTLLSACNTVQGMGKDLQRGGQELQKAANEN